MAQKVESEHVLTPTRVQRRLPEMVLREDVTHRGRNHYEGIMYVRGLGEIQILATKDFQIRDPWSLEAMVPAIEECRDRGWFDGQFVCEPGVGDLRNVLHAGNTMRRVVGVDINEQKVVYARNNKEKFPDQYRGIPIDLYVGDAVEFLIAWQNAGEEPPDRVLMCLPQSYGAGSKADTFKNRPEYARWRQWDPYALTLNAAVLGQLRTMVTTDARVLTVFSDRINEEVKRAMFAETGWTVENLIKRVRVKQDPDTNLDWMVKAVSQGHLIDDRQRFFDHTGAGVSIAEATRRVRKSERGRKELDLSHDVSVYELAPAPLTMRTATQTVPETVSHVS